MEPGHNGRDIMTKDMMYATDFIIRSLASNVLYSPLAAIVVDYAVDTRDYKLFMSTIESAVLPKDLLFAWCSYRSIRVARDPSRHRGLVAILRAGGYISITFMITTDDLWDFIVSHDPVVLIKRIEASPDAQIVLPDWGDSQTNLERLSDLRDYTTEFHRTLVKWMSSGFKRPVVL